MRLDLTRNRSSGIRVCLHGWRDFESRPPASQSGVLKIPTPMKFNPRSARVLFVFGMASINAVIARLLVVFVKKDPHRIVLFGHNFYGSLRALYDFSDWKERGLELRYLYLDHRQYKAQRSRYPSVLSAMRLDHMIWVARAKTIVMDRHPGVLAWVTKLNRDLVSVQLWHGVGFKSWQTEVFAGFREFTLFLAPSRRFRDVWHARGEGPDYGRFKLTGLARTDYLVRPLMTREELVKAAGLNPGVSRYVLIAPTWKQDDANRMVVPFQMEPEVFYRRLDEWAAGRNVQVVFRSHLNTVSLEKSSNSTAKDQSLRHVVFRSMSDYPFTEDLLLVSDVLVSDWSGIATDFLVLDRPAVFLDVPEPFKPGARVLDPADRCGPLVRDMDALISELNAVIGAGFDDRYREERQRVRLKAFDDTLDGHSSQRCLDEVLMAIGKVQ